MIRREFYVDFNHLDFGNKLLVADITDVKISWFVVRGKNE